MNDRYQLGEIVDDATKSARFYRFMDPSGLVVGGNVTPHWMRDGASFWYGAGQPNDREILRVESERCHYALD